MLIRMSMKKNINYQLEDNDNFWKKEGKRIDWIKPYKK